MLHRLLRSHLCRWHLLRRLLRVPALLQLLQEKPLLLLQALQPQTPQLLLPFHHFLIVLAAGLLFRILLELMQQVLQLLLELPELVSPGIMLLPYTFVLWLRLLMARLTLELCLLRLLLLGLSLLLRVSPWMRLSD